MLPPRTPAACIKDEEEPNDKLLDSYQYPPICRDTWIVGSLPEGDGGDYLRVEVSDAGTFEAVLEGVPQQRDYDLLLYAFDGRVVASSQRPGSMDELISVSVQPGPYALRVYPSIGRDATPYRLRWTMR